MDLEIWISGGVLTLLLYLVVSNLAWLLIGSRLLQFLPGVDIKGFRGTVRIAAMLALSAVGVAVWLACTAWSIALRRHRPGPVQHEVAKWVARGSRWTSRIFDDRSIRTVQPSGKKH